MITGFLSLLCLGLCLGFEDEHKNEKLPKPSLKALPGPVVERRANVTLKCHCHFQNVTAMLGKLQDPGYKQEQHSAGYDAEFVLVGLEPETAGTYFCAYQTMGSHEWSEKSEPLQLVITDIRDAPGASSVKTDTRIIFVTTFSCLIIFLLFPSVFLIYRYNRQGSSHEEATKRTGFAKQEASGLSMLERESLSTEDPQEDTSADVNNKAPSEEEPPGSCE
ncbi:V-set and transmembrane domain-containing protein 1-like [Pteronotus mesoamericanus]|uniref:V-set and transmembrane domain-containing protein 1-like n=1 Tax=Pteronotus mesoamericanus TaxID=1884717 RepID=UPI0023ED6FB4|nr:V-set and transmembrane domain-containing protein 1-like [Pteronotus parnellii mesoamericanus]